MLTIHIALIATGKDFEETTNRLKHMMTGPNGGLEWSKEHNSKFEVSKSAIMHFTRQTIQDPANNTRIPTPKCTLLLEGQLVKEATTYKYLSILINNQLKWKEQAN